MPPYSDQGSVSKPPPLLLNKFYGEKKLVNMIEDEEGE
jgi:hypothetical protein